jgi:hypothetical protein
MVRRNRSHLRLVVDNTAPRSAPPSEVNDSQQPQWLDNTMVREFKGPFAHLRARFAYETFVDWGTWQLVGWMRFSLLDPSTWFYARVEAVNSLTLRDWNRLENYTRTTFGRKWRLHHPHRFHRFTA